MITNGNILASSKRKEYLLLHEAYFNPIYRNPIEMERFCFNINVLSSSVSTNKTTMAEVALRHTDLSTIELSMTNFRRSVPQHFAKPAERYRMLVDTYETPSTFLLPGERHNDNFYG